jgi:CubicO group peptidase (beta-lactamase class C family)
MNRRSFLRNAAAASFVGRFASVYSQAQETRACTIPPPLTGVLNGEINNYMTKMNSPGLGLALTDLEGHDFISAYGLEDLDTKKSLTPERLFQIGSISKSMGVIVALQLVDEGKLDLSRPVMEYLPWLPWETPFGAVTTHHIFTHTTGLPEGGALVFAHSEWKHRQRYAPGEHYFYSNMAFNVVGHLIEKLDGRSYQQSLLERLFTPLEMTSTLPQLGGAEWARQAISYIPNAPDRPYLRNGSLRQAPAFHEQTSAGCVASTPADMTKYMHFLLRGGVTGGGKRLLSQASYEKMTHRWIATDEWGPTAGYGYGIAVDEEDGDRILLHTGGMISFMSSIYLNLSQGIGAFASINAQQGYRPRPVTRFAVRALKSSKSGGKIPMPAPIVIPDDQNLSNAAEFAGIYESSTGSHISIAAQGTQLKLHASGKILAMRGSGEKFLVDDAKLGATTWIFERDAQKQIIGLGHGPEFYRRQGAVVPSPAASPKNWEAYVGDYVNDDPWVLSSMVYQRNGKLFLDDELLSPLPDGTFYVESEEFSPDRVAFAGEIDGRAQILLVNGTEQWRFRPNP